MLLFQLLAALVRKVPGNVRISDVSEEDEDVQRKKNLICLICNDLNQQATEDNLGQSIWSKKQFLRRTVRQLARSTTPVRGTL